jgi:hypothetical protein
VIDAPRNIDSKHASEAPKTYARRPASVFHAISRIVSEFQGRGNSTPRDSLLYYVGLPER